MLAFPCAGIPCYLPFNHILASFVAQLPHLKKSILFKRLHFNPPATLFWAEESFTNTLCLVGESLHQHSVLGWLWWITSPTLCAWLAMVNHFTNTQSCRPVTDLSCALTEALKSQSDYFIEPLVPLCPSLVQSLLVSLALRLPGVMDLPSLSLHPLQQSLHYPCADTLLQSSTSRLILSRFSSSSSSSPTFGRAAALFSGRHSALLPPPPRRLVAQRAHKGIFAEWRRIFLHKRHFWGVFRCVCAGRESLSVTPCRALEMLLGGGDSLSLSLSHDSYSHSPHPLSSPPRPRPFHLSILIMNGSSLKDLLIFFFPLSPITRFYWYYVWCGGFCHYRCHALFGGCIVKKLLLLLLH